MVALFLAVALAAEDPQWLVDYANQHNVEAITETIKIIKIMPVKKGRTDSDESFASLKEKNKMIDAAEQRLKLAKQFAKGVGDIPLIPGAPQIGDCGRIDANFNVIQIVSDNEMIVQIRDDGVNSSNVYWAWVETDTKGYIDGQNITFAAPVRVVGTKRYTTITGASKTLLHIVPWTATEKKRFYELVKTPIEAKK